MDNKREDKLKYKVEAKLLSSSPQHLQKQQMKKNGLLTIG